MIVTLFVATILAAALLSMPISSLAQESNSTTVVSTDDKIAMIKDMAGLENEELTFTFYVHNTDSIAANNVTLLHSSLTMKEGSGAFSWAPSVIDLNSVDVKPRKTHIEPHGVLPANYTIKEGARQKIWFNEATYVGTIKIVGDNFEEQTIETEVTFRYNPYWYLVFTFIGIILAIVTGHVFYTRWEMTQKMAKDANDDVDIIDDINGHITSVNLFRNAIDSSAWGNIRKEYELMARDIELDRDAVSLNSDAKAVTWFKLLDESIHANKIFDVNDPKRKNPELPLIDQLDARIRDDRLNDRIEAKKKFNWDLVSFISKKIRRTPITYDEEIRSIGSKKVIYVIAVSIMASFVSILANASFLGNILMTASVGIAIGFAAYRVQDISGLLAPSSSDS